jgi:hypothetical protein
MLCCTLCSQSLPRRTARHIIGRVHVHSGTAIKPLRQRPLRTPVNRFGPGGQNVKLPKPAATVGDHHSYSAARRAMLFVGIGILTVCKVVSQL